MQNLESKSKATRYLVLPIVVLVVCSCIAVCFIFYNKFQDSVNYPSNIGIDAKAEAYMNVVEMIYKQVAKRDINEFQRYAEATNSVPAWIFKQTGDKNELTVLASSQHPNLIGEILPYKI